MDVSYYLYEPFHSLSSGEGSGISPAPSFSWYDLYFWNVSQQRPESVFGAVAPGVSCQKRASSRIFAMFRHSLAKFSQLLQLSYWPIKWLYLSWHSWQYIKWYSFTTSIIILSQPRHFRTFRSTFIIGKPHKILAFRVRFLLCCIPSHILNSVLTERWLLVCVCVCLLRPLFCSVQVLREHTHNVDMIPHVESAIFLCDPNNYSTTYMTAHIVEPMTWSLSSLFLATCYHWSFWIG